MWKYRYSKSFVCFSICLQIFWKNFDWKTFKYTSMYILASLYKKQIESILHNFKLSIVRKFIKLERNQMNPATLTCQVPNNCAADLLFFGGKKHLHNLTLLGPTRLLISAIFPSKPDFYLHKWEKNPSYTALLEPTRLLISEKSATYTIIWSYTIMWQVIVCIFLRISLKDFETIDRRSIFH